ncbi:hypothetical protein AB0N17_02920 [Streptomyces sp. NPDC051133]|uniref:hypothetical protein n=1 Tax=Streptomyces sp. NPDC051133 TaxID=3155521 RepID=UPI0034323A31
MSTTERIKLPSGAWIQLKDPNTLRRGDRQSVLRAIRDPEETMGAGLDMINGLLRVLVIDWSYSLPIPSESPGSLDLLPLEDDDAITEAIEPIRLKLFPNKPDPVKDATDPASPTEPSAD